MGKRTCRTRCKLPPVERQDLFTMQEVRQKAGWQITSFHLPQIWKYTQGEGTAVAVLDSGIDSNHPDLKENILKGRNFVQRGRPPEDDNGHGSHCSGIISASDNDIGIVGVAPKCKIVPVKVLNNKGNGNAQWIAQGIRWAVDEHVDFINMSLGIPRPVRQVQHAIDYAVSKGIVVICAAGNVGRTKEIFYPAAYPSTIGVGAIDQHRKRAVFSNTGSRLDFLAPGVDILSTVPDSWYATQSGTSMAGPFVAALCSLLLSYKKKYKLDIPLRNAEDYRIILSKFVVDSNNKNRFLQGFGVIDPRRVADWMESQL